MAKYSMEPARHGERRPGIRIPVRRCWAKRKRKAPWVSPSLPPLERRGPQPTTPSARASPQIRIWGPRRSVLPPWRAPYTCAISRLTQPSLYGIVTVPPPLPLAWQLAGLQNNPAQRTRAHSERKRPIFAGMTEGHRGGLDRAPGARGPGCAGAAAAARSPLPPLVRRKILANAVVVVVVARDHKWRLRQWARALPFARPQRK